jgi:hypothetical protein
VRDHGSDGNNASGGRGHGPGGHDRPGARAPHGHAADQPDDTGGERDHGPDGPDGSDPAAGRRPDQDRPGGSHGPPGAPATAMPVPAAYRRPRIIVTVPLSTLLGQPLSPGASISSGAGGTPLTAEAARRLACDAEIIRLITHPPDTPGPPGTGLDSTRLDATGQLTQRLAAANAQLPPPLATPPAVLDIGRKSPGWTPRQRDALHTQYGGHCAAPRCTGPIDVLHHIRHWLFGGKTRIPNGCPFCNWHHWLVHEGGWLVQKHPDATITLHPPPPGWTPGTIYRHGKPITE